MTEALYLLTICFFLLAILLPFAMKYGAAVLQARARAAGEDAYRGLAQQSAASQTESAASLSGIQTDLAEIKTRLTAVEKILKAVE